MIIKYFLYLYIYIMQFFDWIIAHTIGIDRIIPFVQSFSDTLLSIYGTFFASLPETFSTFGWYINLWFSMYIAYLVIRVIMGIVIGKLIARFLGF